MVLYKSAFLIFLHSEGNKSLLFWRHST